MPSEACRPGWLVPDYPFRLGFAILLGSCWMLSLWKGAGQGYASDALGVHLLGFTFAQCVSGLVGAACVAGLVISLLHKRWAVHG